MITSNFYFNRSEVISNVSRSFVQHDVTQNVLKLVCQQKSTSRNALTVYLTFSTGNGNSPPFSPDQRPWFYSGRTGSQLLPVKESVISDDYSSGQQFQQQQQSPIFNALPELSAEFERCLQMHGGDHQQVGGGGSKAIAVPSQASSGGGGYQYMASPSATGIAKELKMQEEREMEKKMEGKVRELSNSFFLPSCFPILFVAPPAFKSRAYLRISSLVTARVMDYQSVIRRIGKGLLMS